MDDLGLELFSTDKQKEIVDGKSIYYRANIKHWPDYLIAKGIHRFPDYLNIEQISDLLFPFFPPKGIGEFGGNIECSQAFKDKLIDACIEDDLSYKGDVASLNYFYKMAHPLAKKGHKVGDTSKRVTVGDRKKEFEFCDPSKRVTVGDMLKRVKAGDAPKGVYFGDAFKRAGVGDALKIFELGRALNGVTDITIHKNEFKRYFKSIDQWHLVNKGLLAGWWVDNPGGKSEPPATKAQKETDNLNPYSDFELKGVDLQNANNILGRNPRIIDKYLVCLWITSGMNDNKYFYPSLKKHTRHKVAGSPIEEWSLAQIQHSSGKPIKKKTIGTKISQWKNTVKS